ncbi:MAG: hypothetical protein ABI318_14545 [Chthoniobacteraceae bacterium]
MKKWQGIYDVRIIKLARGRLAPGFIARNQPAQTAVERRTRHTKRASFVSPADWTVEQGLGTAFTPETHDAWAAHVVFATTMKNAAPRLQSC